MNKIISKKPSLIILFATSAFICVVLGYIHFIKGKVECVGEANWVIDNRQFNGAFFMRMHKGEGLAVINGKLRGSKTSDVSRSIYFRYTRKHQAWVLKNIKIVKTFADTADEGDLQRTLPAFYHQSGSELSLMVNEFRGAWLFSTSNVPSLYCRKSSASFSF